MQITDTVLMVSPDHFEYNVETATTNYFQTKLSVNNINEEAMQCFHRLVETLKSHGVNVLLLKSNPKLKTPDAVFPNNWFSVQKQNNQLTLILYPMLDPNRRAERQQNELLTLLKNHQIHIDKVIDLTCFETENKALEGTGSIVFDHDKRVMYVSLSPRSNEEVLNKLINEINYEAVTFKSYDKDNHLIYHTNVMMSIAKNFVVICKECIHDLSEQAKVIASLQASGKKIILISIDQVHGMAGNILELETKQEKSVLVMSNQALNAFTSEQLLELRQFTDIVSVDINIIETVGGGSARCMLAEIFK